MPFKSQAQMRKFASLEKEGKLPSGTFNKWKGETKDVSKLPERKKKKRGQHVLYKR